MIKRLKIRNFQHKTSSSQDGIQTYTTIPFDQIPSARKIDLITKDELSSILDHTCQGIVYLSHNLEVLFINEKAEKILMTKSSEIALIELHKLILQGLQQDDNLNKEHQEIKQRASSKILLQKADSKMIESLLASAEKNMKRIESMSEKLLDQKILRSKQGKIQYSSNDFRQLLQSFFIETHVSQLLEHKTCIKANKLKINIKTNYGEKIIIIRFCKLITTLNSGGYLIFLNNITENEKLQQFIQKYQFQTLHFNSFSHELRTPLNCSLSLLQALKAQIISHHLITSYLNPAIVSNKLLMHQINDILDYASFGLGTFQLNIRDVYIHHIFNQLKEYYDDICQTKGIVLIFQIKDNLQNQIIFNDPERILQILVNLLNNSLKFTNINDQITVIAKLKQKSSAYHKEKFIKFIVHDTGRGISKVDLEAINNIIHTSIDRDVYAQLKKFTTKYVGLGFTIGSRMSDELACSQKQYFKIRSQEGKFTKISFRVCSQLQFQNKRKEATIQFSKPDSYDQPYPDQTFENDEHHIPLYTETFFSHKCIQSSPIPQILICDDVAFNLISLRLLIKNLGFASEIAYDGQQAISAVIKRKQFEQPQFRMIFMDIEMPGLNGYQTTKQLLSIDQKLNIIMCSAYDTEDNLSQAVENGMKDFITKPVRIEQLKRLMQKYFK